jgi:hypothetical protein
MMALELLDTKWAGVTRPDAAPPRPASSAWRLAPDQSETCSEVMMWDTWLRTVLGLTPKTFATPALSPPRKVPAAYISRTGLGTRWVCSAHRYVPSAITGMSTVSSNSVPWKVELLPPDRGGRKASSPELMQPCATPFPASRRPKLSGQTSRWRWQPRYRQAPRVPG